MGELLKNVERSMYVFNLNNIIDICYEKTINIVENGSSKDKLSQSEKILVDNCIDKYMQSFGIVKTETLSHISDIFKNS
jgi:hypothetical protein